MSEKSTTKTAKDKELLDLSELPLELQEAIRGLLAGKDKPPKEKEIEWEWLADLMDRALWPLTGFAKMLEDRTHEDDMLLVLKPLMDLAKSNLDKLEEVLAQSFGGYIKIETSPFIRNLWSL